MKIYPIHATPQSCATCDTMTHLVTTIPVRGTGWEFGGASVLASLRPKLLPGPHQIKHPAFERPIFNPLNQSLPNWISLNIKPLLGIILTITQPVMPSTRLKFPFCHSVRWGERPREPFMFQRKFPLPVGNPRFDGEMQISRRAKQMQMIRHQQIIAHQPSGRLRPRLTQKSVRRFVCQPRLPFVGVDGQ